jgi:predicted Rossmann fold nucleotide-binding protein DprA/Smf involved in DNA uptake
MTDKTIVIEPESHCYPAALLEGAASAFPRLWALGNLEILKERLLGLFCSARCAGDVIVKTYDAVRMLRDASVPVISGFHSPMEQECLNLLLRGKQPIVICPARSIVDMRIPAAWKESLADNHLLVLSPFERKHRHITVVLAEQRNRFVAALASTMFVPYAAPGSKIERLALDLLGCGKKVMTLGFDQGGRLTTAGAVSVNADSLAGAIHR